MGHCGYRFALLLVTMVLLPHFVAAQDPFNSQPLRVDDPTTLEVVIEALSEHAAIIGLTEDRIRDRIEIKLLRSGITYKEPSASGDAFLYVNFNVIPHAASVGLEFSRVVYFQARGETRATPASVWNQRIISSIGNLDLSDADNLLSILDINLDAFLADYLRDNQ